MKRLITGGLLSAAIAFGISAGANAAPEVMKSGNVYHIRACQRVVGLAASCHAHIVTDAKGNIKFNSHAPVAGYGPADLRQAYAITANGSSSTVVAIVDAFGYDNAEADLNSYRSNFGLSACTTENGCFKKLNQKGKQKDYPAQNIGWAQESALDVDMASAMCPNCQIWLMESNDNSFKNLSKTVDKAAELGAHVISNSYGGADGKGAVALEGSYNHPGVAITASTGDSGYGAQTPAAMPHLTAVGGTRMVRDSGSARGFTETVWSGAGSGCSKHYDKPSWQHDTGCATRMEADVSAVADPATGVAVFGPRANGVSGWLVFGGTSVSAPLIGGIYGANGGTVTFGSDPYNHLASFNDVTSGSNGTCKGGTKAYFCNGAVGYDGPTGLGTPISEAGFGEH